MGATFAYFTASNSADSISGAGTGEVTTTKLGDTTFTFEGNSLTKSYLDYPGGLAVFGSKASFEKSGDGTDENTNYDLKFDLEIEYENETQTDLYWALYMVESESLDDSLDPDCKINTKVDATSTQFWYGDTGGDGVADNGKSCTLTQQQKAILQNTTMVAYGKFAHTDSKQSIGDDAQIGKTNAEIEGNETSLVTCDSELCNPSGTNENPLKGRTLNTSTTPNKSYYLVVQYPNKDDQSEDEGSKISVNLKVKAGSPKVTAAGAQGSQE